MARAVLYRSDMGATSAALDWEWSEDDAGTAPSERPRVGWFGRPVLDERFELVDDLGCGGFGAVFRSRDRESGAWVAVKVLHSRELAPVLRFLREARCLSSLDHPGIVRYIAQGVSRDGRPYLVMELVEGDTLADLLAARPLSTREAIDCVTRAAEALGVAHARGLVHRDVKPDNLLLVDGDPAQPKVLDFGVAHVAGAEAITGTGIVVGSAGYLAPEQARGATVDARTDVFSLGCVLFECLTSKPAFPGRTFLDRVVAVLSGPPPHLERSLRGLPPALRSLVARCLSPDPDERPSDGAALARELSALRR
jgi:serine/threonine protein kinase